MSELESSDEVKFFKQSLSIVEPLLTQRAPVVSEVFQIKSHKQSTPHLISTDALNHSADS